MTTSLDITQSPILYGSHKPPKQPPKDPADIQACAMELAYLLDALNRGVSWDEIVRGWTDHADCVDRSIGACFLAFNDRCGTGPDADERRKRVLGPLLPIIIGTRSTKELQKRRAWLGVDWSWRFALPKLLRQTSMAEWADKLEALPAIVDDTSLTNARLLIDQCREAAWSKRNAAWQKIHAAAVAVAVAAAAAVAAAVDIKRIVAAAEKARLAGGGWSEQYNAARAVADEVMPKLIRPRFLAVRDELDAGLSDLIRRMAALS